MVTVNWMLDEVVDVETDLAFGILEHILIGTPASPLYKALINSRLGEDIAGRGLDDGFRSRCFRSASKASIRDADKIERTDLETLRALADEGVDRMTVEAALNTVEFRLRENNTGAFPRGIAFMLRALRDWLHGRDPLSPLAFEAPLRTPIKPRCRRRALFRESDRPLSPGNPHRTILTLRPDPEQAEREAAEERQRLDARAPA